MGDGLDGLVARGDELLGGLPVKSPSVGGRDVGVDRLAEQVVAEDQGVSLVGEYVDAHRLVQHPDHGQRGLTAQRDGVLEPEPAPQHGADPQEVQCAGRECRKPAANTGHQPRRDRLPGGVRGPQPREQLDRQEGIASGAFEQVAHLFVDVRPQDVVGQLLDGRRREGAQTYVDGRQGAGRRSAYLVRLPGRARAPGQQPQHGGGAHARRKLRQDETAQRIRPLRVVQTDEHRGARGQGLDLLRQVLHQPDPVVMTP